MKILIFSTAYFPFVGGAEVAVKEITDRLSEHEFVMITARMDRNLPKQERIGRVEVRRLGWGLPFFDKILLAVCGHCYSRRLAKKNKFDAVWAIMASFGGLAAMSFKQCHKDTPFLLTLQEGDDLKHISRRAFWVGFSFRKIFKRADYIQAISSYLAEWAKKMGATCLIEVIPNGVDLNRFTIDDFRFPIDDARKKLGIEKSEKIVLSVSRLVKKNGLADLIKAVASLAMPVKLLVCGTGQEENRLKKLAKNLRAENKILFLGHIAHDKLPKYYALADVFCRPSLSEGLGNVFLEAMASGAPVVATPVGGIPDFLVDGRTGWFCRVGNPASIAEKINFIVNKNNAEAVAEVVSRARKMVEEKYEWNKISGQIKNILNKLLN